jgi:homoserine kinase
MESLEKGLVVEVEGEGADELPRDSSNLMVRAARSVFERLGWNPPGLRLHAENRIPLSSGLGSSAAAVVGAVTAANELGRGGLSTDEILALSLEWEGHADNAAASLYGGLNLVSVDSHGILARQVPIPSIKVAVAQPSFGLSTQSMRQALPSQVSLVDAATNLGRALLTVEALRSGDYNFLARAMKDRLHEPFRARFIPGFEQVIDAARRAGAAAVTLSGAGPSLVGFAPMGHERIARAMVEAWAGFGVEARPFALGCAAEGVSRE